MDAAYLERYLEQQDVWGSIALDQVGEKKQITVLEYLQQRSSTSESLNSSHEVMTALIVVLPLIVVEISLQLHQSIFE
jgi:hypothetical protein